MILQHIFSYNNKLYYITKEKKDIIQVSSNLTTNPSPILLQFIKKDFPEEIKKAKKNDKKEIKLKNEDLLLNAITNNIVNYIVYKNDLFLDKPKIEIENKILTIIYNTQYFKDIQLSAKEQKLKEEIINDYKKHFKQLDEVLNFFIACRFAENRRHSYLYLRMNAGFGKSFFLSILEELTCAISVKYEDFKVPTGLEVERFNNTFVFAIDEFLKFNHELKNLTNKLEIEPKFKAKATVELYAKLFLSAEKSKSIFMDGVTQQIIDRLNLINLDNEQKLDNRELFNNNSTQYKKIIKYYINQFFIKKFDYYKKLEKTEALNTSTKYLKEFHKNYKLKTPNIETFLQQEIYYFIVKNTKKQVNDEHPDSVFSEFIKIINKNVYILKPNTFFKEFLDKEIDEDEIKKSAKYLNIEDILKTKRTRPRIEKEQKHAIVLILDKIKNSLSDILQDEEIKEDEMKKLIKDKNELKKELEKIKETKEKLKRENEELKNEIQKITNEKTIQDEKVEKIIHEDIAQDEKIEKIKDIFIEEIPFF